MDGIFADSVGRVLKPMNESRRLEALSTEADILQLVEARLSSSIIKRLVTLGLERSEIDETVIQARTLQHRRSWREKFSVEESDRVLRVVSAAETVHGSRARALAWLRTQHPPLQKRTPLSPLTTDTGSRIVEELLVQIDESMYI